MGSKSYSKGISWINDCRIPFVDEGESKFIEKRSGIGGHQDNMVGGKPITFYKYKEQSGRFPANILVSDDMLNDGVITKQSQRTYKPTDKSASLFGNSPQSHGIGIGDKGTNSRYYDIDKWFDNLIDV